MAGINAPFKPTFEGQIVKFTSPYANVVLYDICQRNPKYGNFEWWALNEPTEAQKQAAEAFDEMLGHPMEALKKLTIR